MVMTLLLVRAGQLVTAAAHEVTVNWTVVSAVMVVTTGPVPLASGTGTTVSVWMATAPVAAGVVTVVLA